MPHVVGFDADQNCAAVAARAKAANVGFIARYLKNLTSAEVKVLSGAAIKIVSIFESTAMRALGGAAAGRADAATAAAQAKVLGQPAGSAIYCTVDFDTTVAQQPAVMAYINAFDDGVTAAGYRSGVYANGAICQAALDNAITKLTWLAGGSAMRGTKAFATSGRATMVQDVADKQGLNLGISIDSDTALVDDYGGWVMGQAVVAPAPPAPPAAPQVTSTILRLGMSGTDVGTLQGALCAAGVLVDIDDDFGSLTAAAVKAYQRAHGLTVDGIAGPATLTALGLL